jgi:glycosyltransferase involved in cell wall biosynthesis
MVTRWTLNNASGQQTWFGAIQFKYHNDMHLRNSLFRLHPSAPYYMCSGDGPDRFLDAQNYGKAVVFFHPPWYVSIFYARRLAAISRKLLRKDIRMVVCCNQKSELKWAKVFRLDSVLFNQNFHLPEQVFRPVHGASSDFDAIYVAQAKPFKRLQLAAKINRLFVLTYFSRGKNESGDYDLHQFQPEIAHCDFNKGFIHDPDEICQLYARSACGLALSRKEGAMWASMEYLLAGLPVVTTPNIGGRDRYFRSEYVKWVKPNPQAVAEAVKFFVENPPDRAAIRRKVLELIENDRMQFLEYLNHRLHENGFIPTTYDYIWGGDSGIYGNREEIVPLGGK